MKIIKLKLFSNEYLSPHKSFIKTKFLAFEKIYILHTHFYTIVKIGELMEAENKNQKLNDIAFYFLMSILAFSILFLVGYIAYSSFIK